jgi:outer membrane biosynthesis protein TonB
MNNFPIGQHFSGDQKQARNLTVLVHIGFVFLLFLPWYIQSENRQGEPNESGELKGDGTVLRLGDVGVARGEDIPLPNIGGNKTEQPSERSDRDVVTQDNGNVPLPKKEDQQSDGDAKNRADEKAADDKKIGTPVNNEDENGKGIKGNPEGGLDPKPGNGMGTLNGKIGPRWQSGNQVLEGNFGQIGTVIVKIFVDPNGKIVKTEYSSFGSTTSDPVLVKAAVQYAKQMKFAAKPEALGDEYGELKVVFKTN